MPSDDKLIAAILAAAVLQKQGGDASVAPNAEQIVSLYFQCLEAIHAERLKRYSRVQNHV